MVSRLQRRLESHEVKGIDMSPLLDVVFILLIFFIVSTVFVKETGVEVDKPQAISAQKLDQMAIMLAITQTNDVMYDNANIGVNGVRSTVEQLLMKEPRPVVIQVDKAVRSEVLVEVIDEAKLAGAATVNIATAGSISNVELVVEGLTHTRVGDIDVILTSPSGKFASIMSAVGTGDDSNFGGDYIFADSGADLWAAAATAGDSDTIPSSTYFASINDGSMFDLTGEFAGENPLGNWTVEISDGQNGEIGSFTGVTLRITA